MLIVTFWLIDNDELDGGAKDYLDDDDELNDLDDDEKGADEQQETPGEKRLNMKDNPLDRRALQSLEKQLQLEPPESEFDLSVNYKSKKLSYQFLCWLNFKLFFFSVNKLKLIRFLQGVPQVLCIRGNPQGPGVSKDKV